MTSNGATRQTRNDGVLYNVFTGMGTAKDKSQYTQVGLTSWLNDRQMSELACDIFLGLICSAKPDAATDKWCRLSFNSDSVAPETVQAFEDYRNKIGGESDDEELITDREIFAEACYNANVYRGAAIILDVNDGQPPDQPINSKRIKTIASAQVLDSFKIYPDLKNSLNPKTASHYEIFVPQYGGERLTKIFDGSRFHRKGMGYSYRIHRSRVLRIPGVRVPQDIQLRNQGWDRSFLEQLFEIFRDWKSAYSNTGNILHDYSLFVYMVAGLRDMQSEDQEPALRSRFQTFRQSITALGGAAIDKDEESIDFIQRQFGGIPDIMDRFRDMLIGASGIPHTILFGESPSGLGATGESEEKTWQNTVSQYQSRVILPRLNRLYRLIFQSQDGPTNGEELEGGWEIEFLPLHEEPIETKILNQSTVVNTLGAAINGGWLTEDEARLTFSQGNGYEIVLNDELWEAKKNQQNQGFDFGGMGGSDPFAAEAAPEEEAPPEEEEPAVKQDSSRLDRGEVFADKQLYEQVYQASAQKFKIPSAYRSAWMVREYKKRFKEKNGGMNGAFVKGRSDGMVLLGSDGSVLSW